MATLVRDVAPPARPPERAPTPPAAVVAWPHTNRPMPWLIAAFLVMVYLIPFDSTVLPISLPFNAGLDRLVLVVVTVVWLVLSLGGRRPPRVVHSPTNVAVWVFVALTALSLALNLRDLTWDTELGPSLKQLLLAYTYLLFFYVAASSLTREDVRAFCRFLVVLAAVSALGTILEYRSHHNLFATLGHLIPGARVHFRSTVGNGNVFTRVSYGGPAKHGLADATMLDTALPFALVFMTRTRNLRARLGWGVALIALIAGCVATQEKTAFILIAVSLIVVVALQPRRYARWWPLLLIAIPIIRVAAPHAISELTYQFKTARTSSSTDMRTQDYPAVAPFINQHLLFGRGFASYSPRKYRILDDQMLQFLIDTGVIGFLSYSALIFTPALSVLRRARRGLTLDDDLFGALAAGCVAFFVSNFLYDSFSFRQGPYVFFFIAALTVALSGWRRGGSSDDLDPPAVAPAAG
jgi:hypothetical protein